MSKNTAQPSQAAIIDAIHASHQKIKDWPNFHTVLESMRDTGWIFRGVTSPSHYPVPSIGREAQYGHYKRAQEERLFEEFKLRAIALMTDPRFTDGTGSPTRSTWGCPRGCLIGPLVRS